MSLSKKKSLNGQSLTFKCKDIPSFFTGKEPILPILNEIEDLIAGPKLILGASTPQSDERKWVGALRSYGNAVIAKLPGGSDLSSDLTATIDVLPKGTDPGDKSFDLLDLALVSSLAQKGEALLSEAQSPVSVVFPERPAVNEFDELFDVNGLVDTLRQELCIQKDAESRWKNLVKTMAPNCLGIDDIFLNLETVINGALEIVGEPKCPVFGPTIPPHYETSLEALVKTPRLGP